MSVGAISPGKQNYRQTGWMGTVEVNWDAGLEPGETFLVAKSNSIRGLVRPWVRPWVGPSVTRFSKTANSSEFNKIHDFSQLLAG